MSVTALLPGTEPRCEFHVTVSTEGTSTVVALRGEADVATLPVLMRALSCVVADHHGDVVVDLAQTSFIDTATLRAVLQAREALNGSGRRLTIRSPSRIAGRLLTVFGLFGLVSPQETRAMTA